jgi:CheY-like chemotaxis protein
MTPARKPISILVVEDNLADAELLIDGLRAKSNEVRVHHLRDGTEALAFLHAHNKADELPDLVLMDLNLPRLSGLDALGVLRADATLRRIPVLILTTSKSQREINRSYELGAAAVLNKPMRLADHREMIDAIDAFWLRQVKLPREGL